MSAYYPDRIEFLGRAKPGKLISVYREVMADMETPVSAFKKIDDGGNAFLLESVEGGERIARYSFLGVRPRCMIKSKGREIEIQREGLTETVHLEEGQDPLDVLKAELTRYEWETNPDLPKFCGGAVGFIGYDMVRFFEDLPDNTQDDLDVSDCLFALTDTILIFDHVRNKIRVLANARVDDDPNAAYDQAIQRIDALIERLRQPLPVSQAATCSGKSNNVVSNFTTPAEFETAVEKCKEYISSGDVIQVVLSQRFSVPVKCSPFDIYRALRSINPSPYMYYLSFGDIKLIGSSPEILVTQEKGVVTTRPIAGTRPRSQDYEQDKMLETELLADVKERAEHIMLVDLGRNDIGRVCKYGSVSVDQLMSIERYSHVMHIVSNVRGELLPDKDQFDLLRASFPAGTVSGAPKVRAMQIIDELEPTKRGTYAGAIGYFSYSGSMDTCITIRTILIKGNTAYVQAGAGIVADSVPVNEYQESVNKATAMIRAIQMADEGLE